MKNITILIIFLTLLLNVQLSGQGWERTYFINSTMTTPFITATKTENNNILIYNESHDELLKINKNGDSTWISLAKVGGLTSLPSDGMEDFPKDNIIANSDGTFFTIDDSYRIINHSIPNNNQFFQLVKYTAKGDTLWTKRHQLKRRLNDAKRLSDNNLIALANNDSTISITKLNHQNGAILWDATLSAYPSDRMIGFEILENPDGTFMVYGEETANNNTLKMYFFAKLSSSGNQLWKKTYVSNHTNFGMREKTLARTNTGEYIITRKITDLVSLVDSNYVMKFDAQGNEVWRTVLGLNTYKHFYNLTINTEGNIMVAGESGSSAYLAKLDDDGNIIWEKSISNPLLNPNSAINQFTFSELVEINPNEFIAIGTYNYNVTTTFDQIYYEVFAAKIDSLGNTKSNFITGKIYNDVNFDCNFGNEITLGNVMVQLVDSNTDTFYQMADAQGYYEFDAVVGTYSISAIPHHSHWQSCPPQIINFTTKYDTVSQDLGLQPFILCPDLLVDISTPVLVRCFSSTFTVAYSNIGSDSATNAYIEVELDAFLDIDSTSIPYTQNGNIYTFYVGNLQINQTGFFLIHTTVNCNAILGQTHCVEAAIYPNEICLPTGIYNGGEVQTKIFCEGLDSIRYQIRNDGDGNMSQPRQYYVIEDQILQYQSSFQLNSGSDTSWIVPAFSGVTYRLEAEQELTHPFPNQIVSDFGFNCDTVSTILNVPINQFDLNDYDGNTDIHCIPNVGSFDPNDKQGFPIGYGDQHFINKNQAIEYLIRFQNTGTYLAFNVRVEDKIDTELLDLSTLKILSTSHDYKLEIIDGNTLNFLFLNIMLPDSNSNEAESHGYIRFKINQKMNNPLGSVIENSADIYFDFNEPIITNTTVHTIGENFVQVVSTKPIKEKLANVKVFPNPFSEQATFEIETDKNYQNLNLTIYNIMGQTVKTLISDNNNRIVLDRNGLKAGIYFYKIQSDNAVLDSGKIIVN